MRARTLAAPKTKSLLVPSFSLLPVMMLPLDDHQVAMQVHLLLLLHHVPLAPLLSSEARQGMRAGLNDDGATT